MEASEALMEFYKRGFSAALKEDGSPVTEADMASSKIIREILNITKIPVIDEESDQVSYNLRKKWNLCWCVDPLDGTKEFIKKNDEFAVNIALISDGKPLFGLIASPVQKEILLGGKEIGVARFDFDQFEKEESWKRLSAGEDKNEALTLISSRTHHSGTTLDFINTLRDKYGEFETIKKGSSLKFYHLAEHANMIYPRFAPTMEWDIAAGQAILEALGGKVIHAENREALTYNKENLRNPYFIAVTQLLSEDFS